MIRVEARSASGREVEMLARLTFSFVREQIDSVTMLVRLLCGGHQRASDAEEYERW